MHSPVALPPRLYFLAGRSPTPAQFVERERPERARVTLTDGSQIVLEHIVLRADKLIGTVRGQNQKQDVRVPLTDVRQVANRRFSAGRTVGLVVGVAAGRNLSMILRHRVG